MENRTPINDLVRNSRVEKSEADYTRFLGEYEALKGGAALVDRSDRCVLRLAGRDPVEMLNAILTNEMPKDTNLGVYGALLNPKGRIQTDLRVLKSGTDILIDTEPEGAGAAREILDRYAPFSRVEIEDLSEDWGILGLYGPRAKDLVGALELAEHETANLEFGGARLLAAGVAIPVPGFDLLGSTDALRAAKEHHARKGVKHASPEAYETARVEAGVPRFGADITSENFPAEASILDRAVSFSKGCYPGQETVARMLYRGHPNRTLHRLAIEGPLSPTNTIIVQNEKQVGRITSVAPLRVSGKTLALGYLSRNADPEGPLRAGEAAVLPELA